ncbi:MAG: hypothetical protein AAGF26_16295, partial [Cyanobacteria bacterium P01_G01_bin.49]
FVGYRTLIKGHKYYRQTILTLAKLSNELDIIEKEQPILTTAGQKEALSFLADPDKFVDRPLRFGTITYYLGILFILLILTNIVGIGIIAYHQLA